MNFVRSSQSSEAVSPEHDSLCVGTTAAPRKAGRFPHMETEVGT